MRDWYLVFLCLALLAVGPVMAQENPEAIRHLLQRLQEENPELFRTLIRLREEDPAQFRLKVQALLAPPQDGQGWEGPAEQGPPAPQAPPKIEELERVILELVRQHPDFFFKLLALRQTNPARFEQLMRELTGQEPPREGLEREHLLDLLQRERPQEFRRLQALKRENPAAFEEELQRIAQHNPPAPPPEEALRAKEEFLHKLRQEDPPLFEHLMQLRREEPEKFQDELARFQEQAHQRNQDPVLYKLLQTKEKLEIEEQELIQAYRRSHSETQRTALKSKLRKLLDQLFDAREAVKHHKLKCLRQEADELAKLLEKRKQHKEEIIDRHLSVILGDEWDW